MTLSPPRRLTESEIVENSHDDTLYKSDASLGNSYFTTQSEIEISKKIKVTVFYIKDRDDIGTIYIKKYKEHSKGDWQIEGEIILSNFGFLKLKDLLKTLDGIDLKTITDRKIHLGEDIGITADDQTVKKIKTFLSTDEGFKIVEELINNGNICSKDIISIGYRKQQLEIFRNLLDDEAYFNKYKTEKSITKDESVWQFFFENNHWIFGYGLNYIWCDGIEDKKLEQVIAGFDFNSSGKRIDGLLSTSADIKKFVLVEIKKHNTDLLGGEYRSECWSPSIEFIGGIAQIQKDVHRFKEKYFEKAEIKDGIGNPLGDVFNITPKAYLIIGKLSEFLTDNGVNNPKYSSFELFRNSISGIEVITYDELYERARFIVECSEIKNQ